MAPGPIGGRLGRIVAFLASSLQPATQGRYEAALLNFAEELQSQGLVLGTVSEEDLDARIAEKIVDLFEDDHGLSGLGAASTLVAACSKAFPRHSYRTAWKALEVWRARRPPQQAPAAPLTMAYGAVGLLVLSGAPAAAAGVLLCFHGLLRASEALALRWGCFLRGAAQWTAVLGRTKRGLEQKVVFWEPLIVSWLDGYRKIRGDVQPTDKVVPVAYHTLQKRLQQAAAAMGFAAVHWTTHSLRRGGATAMLQTGTPLSDIMLTGRWLSERSAREYLRRRDVALLRLRHDIDEDAWRRAAALAALGPSVWASFDMRAASSARRSAK